MTPSKAEVEQKLESVERAKKAAVTRARHAREEADKHPVAQVKVDSRNRRDDNDALEGGFVDIVSGEHAGRFGSFDRVTEHDAKDGYPTKILVLSRDEHNQLLTVDYKDARPSARAGGR